jgi:hypothetical protein
VCVWLISSGMPIASGQTLTAHVTADSMAPSDIKVLALVERDARNRYVEFIVRSSDFFRSSVAELQGDRAPRANEVHYRGVPAGRYEVQVTLFGTDGIRGRVDRVVFVG